MDALLSSLPGPVQALAAYLTDRQPLRSEATERVWHGALEASASSVNSLLTWALLFFFLLTLAVIGACIIALRQRSGPPSPENGKPAQDGPKLQPWERPADWWKQQP
jgi:hypothetical protein